MSHREVVNERTQQVRGLRASWPSCDANGPPETLHYALCRRPVRSGPTVGWRLLSVVRSTRVDTGVFSLVATLSV